MKIKTVRSFCSLLLVLFMLSKSIHDLISEHYIENACQLLTGHN